MGERLRVSLYCEDSGHEQFVRALLNRIAGDLRIRRLSIQTVSGRGGHGRALTEFKAWQRAVASGRGIGQSVPDLLVLVIDGNCHAWAEVHRELEAIIDPGIFPRSMVGCPEPHVERWCLADPEAVQSVLRRPAPADPGKCDRNFYKQLLRRTILEAGQPILTNEMEYAPDLVEAMDLYRAGKNQPSLRHFVDQVRKALRDLS